MQTPGFDFSNISIDVLNQYKLLLIFQLNLTINNIVNITDTRTFNNTVQPLINVHHLIEPYKNIFGYVTNF